MGASDSDLCLMRPGVPCNLSRSFSVVTVLQAFLYKPFTPSVIPCAFYFLASPDSKLYSRFCSRFEPRVPSQDLDIFGLRFSANFTTMTGSSSKQSSSIYDFTVKDIRGNDVDLSVYKGKVLLIVNVASQCGLTNSNYTELNEVYTKYKDQGLEILAFPCNQLVDKNQVIMRRLQKWPALALKQSFPYLTR